MKTKTAFLVVLIAFALTFANISPSLADDNTPPGDADVAADIFTLERVNDLAPGTLHSTPVHLVVYSNNLYFSANAYNGYGRELWELGNPTVIDIAVGAESSSPTSLTSYRNAIYFGADGKDGTGIELWRFDWVNGAQRVADINPGSTSSYPHELVVYNNELYFSAYGDDGTGYEIWKLTPTNGIQRVTDINPGIFGSYPSRLTVYNKALYFSAYEDGAGTELWKYDPTQGAQRVADIYPGPTSSNPSDLTVYNGALYFTASGDDTTGGELWMYDDVYGAQRVADIPSQYLASIHYLTAYHGALYFSATTSDTGTELWKYDPVNGADLVADIGPGRLSSLPAYLTVYNGALYFSANGEDGAGIELWKFDNTTTSIFRTAKSHDGWILESGETTNAGRTINSSATTFNLGDDAQNKQYRSILSFNTSTLPDNAIIISATLKIRRQSVVGTNPFTTHEKIAIDIVKGAFGGNNALQAADFQAAPGKLGVGLFKNLPDVNNWFTSVLAKTAYPFINAAGVTQFRLRFQKDDNNDNGADFLRFFSADTANMGDYPTLEVKYYIP